MPRVTRGEPDLERDRADLAVLTAALAIDLPVVGVCRGHQLLNIASGGDLYQDVVSDGATTVEHGAGGAPGAHARRRGDAQLCWDARPMSRASTTRRSAGSAAGLTATATSPDGVVESIERTDRRFALGLQWHPERDPGGSGDNIAAGAGAGGSGARGMRRRPGPAARRPTPTRR